MSETIKSIYPTIDSIPEAYKNLFEERGGQYHLVRIEGIKTEADVARVQRALDAEKNEHIKLKQQWNNFFGERKPEEIQSILDKVPELEAAAAGKIDEEKLSQIVESRTRTKLAPLERELNSAKTALIASQEKIQQFEAKELQRTIHDNIRSAALKSKVVDSALEDILLLSERIFEVTQDGNVVVKDNVGATPGVSAEVWLTEMQQKRPHWWPMSQGGGSRGSAAGGSSVSNPWSQNSWNLTEQSRIYKESPERAAQLAKSAGISIGAVPQLRK